MPSRPNILFLMTDQMQACVLEPDHVCQTPNLDRLAATGLRFRRAYTPNAVCSPARASLMTGLLPHNHGVLEVTHCVDRDQCNIRSEKPHWAQRLVEAGYTTGYFGKWHVERFGEMAKYGWRIDGASGSGLEQEYRRTVLPAGRGEPNWFLRRNTDRPEGYNHSAHYGVIDTPPEQRSMGLITGLALEQFETMLAGEAPWCCFVSVPEPHDPFITGKEAFDRYDVDGIELAPNTNDELAGRPAIYRKVARVWAEMTSRQKREAATCYYASITEIDAQMGRVIDALERSRQLDNTVIVFTTDHGELLGAHGLYCKNFSAYEEVYNIPLIVAGPGVPRGETTEARVGSHDLCPTLLELAGLAPFGMPDSRSFAPVLRDPAAQAADFTTGFAEYHGSRYRVTQRVMWDGPWKYVFNGFDFDELYNLDEDPGEMNNLAEAPEHEARVRAMLKQMWGRLRETNDHALFNSHYPILRGAKFGPGILDG